MFSPVQSDGQQSSEYQKLQRNFDKVITYLAANMDPGTLASKLFARGMLSRSLMEEASVSTIAPSKRIQSLVYAILSLVELNSEKYEQFLNVLEDTEGMDELEHLLK